MNARTYNISFNSASKIRRHSTLNNQTKAFSTQIPILVRLFSYAMVNWLLTILSATIILQHPQLTRKTYYY